MRNKQPSKAAGKNEQDIAHPLLQFLKHIHTYYTIFSYLIRFYCFSCCTFIINFGFLYLCTNRILLLESDNTSEIPLPVHSLMSKSHIYNTVMTPISE